jgi:hypothetical protein
MRAAEHDDGVNIIALLGVVQQLLSEAPLRLDQKVEGILLIGCLRDNRERMGLEKGPEADGGDPQVDISPGIDLQWLLEV